MTGERPLIARVELYQDADYHDASAIAGAIEAEGYDVDHLIDPEAEEPNLYVLESGHGD